MPRRILIAQPPLAVPRKSLFAAHSADGTRTSEANADGVRRRCEHAYLVSRDRCIRVMCAYRSKHALARCFAQWGRACAREQPTPPGGSGVAERLHALVPGGGPSAAVTLAISEAAEPHRPQAEPRRNGVHEHVHGAAETVRRREYWRRAARFAFQSARFGPISSECARVRSMLAACFGAWASAIAEGPSEVPTVRAARSAKPSRAAGSVTAQPHAFGLRGTGSAIVRASASPDGRRSDARAQAQRQRRVAQAAGQSQRLDASAVPSLGAGLNIRGSARYREGAADSTLREAPANAGLLAAALVVAPTAADALAAAHALVDAQPPADRIVYGGSVVADAPHATRHSAPPPELEPTAQRACGSERGSERADGTGSGDAACRICCMGEEEGALISGTCACKGSIAYVHSRCVKAWMVHRFTHEVRGGCVRFSVRACTRVCGRTCACVASALRQPTARVRRPRATCASARSTPIWSRPSSRRCVRACACGRECVHECAGACAAAHRRLQGAARRRGPGAGMNTHTHTLTHTHTHSHTRTHTYSHAHMHTHARTHARTRRLSTLSAINFRSSGCTRFPPHCSKRVRTRARTRAHPHTDAQAREGTHV